MNKEQAWKALLQDKKIRLKSWSKEEYVFIDGEDNLYDEEQAYMGCSGKEEFLSYPVNQRDNWVLYVSPEEKTKLELLVNAWDDYKLQLLQQKIDMTTIEEKVDDSIMDLLGENEDDDTL